MIGTLLTLAAVVLTASSDTSSYVVLNHGRRAGDLVIVRAGDSTVARWIFVDRNRGTRIETRYRFGADKHLASADTRQIAPNGIASDAIGEGPE